MGSIEDDLSALIKEKYGSVPKLAQATGVPAQTIYSVLHSSVTGASVGTVMPIAQALEIDPFALAQGRLESTSADESRTVPVALFKSIAAGQPIEADGEASTYPIPASLHEQYPAAFLLRVSGESMNRVLPNGCYALVDPCKAIDHPKKIYALAVGDRAATIKRVVPLANGLELRPDSEDPTFRPIVLDFAEEDADTVSVIGRVVWYCIPPDWAKGTL